MHGIEREGISRRRRDWDNRKRKAVDENGGRKRLLLRVMFKHWKI